MLCAFPLGFSDRTQACEGGVRMIYSGSPLVKEYIF
jgi:hypothetical protein